MMIVSDASPLISLSQIDELELLKSLYGRLVIPQAVWVEVVELGAGEPGAKEVKQAPWISRECVENAELVKALRQELDAGEAEAIALALELGIDMVLMDERLGREVARHFDLECTGVLGVLIEAKEKGVLNALKSTLNELIEDAGFRISDKLYARVLEEAGEQETR